MNNLRRKIQIALIVFLAFGAGQAPVLADDEGSKPYTVEYYYKIKWGYFDEFRELFKKNHYPMLKVLQERGQILSMTAHYPVNHAGESDRWDMRFTIVYKDIQTTVSDLGDDEIFAELYPDIEKFHEEEQQRFEMIIEHRDVPLWVDDLSDWPETPAAE